jgi:predicted RNA binding protein YcfA (HicA-like mRNA interferase family)
VTRFPVDAPKRRVVRTLERLGFRTIREREHIAMVRENLDGSRTPLTIPNHPRLKGSTLKRSALRLAYRGSTFLEAYESS